jgi:hypothetical protein
MNTAVECGVERWSLIQAMHVFRLLRNIRFIAELSATVPVVRMNLICA